MEKHYQGGVTQPQMNRGDSRESDLHGSVQAARRLTPEEVAKLEKDKMLVSEFKQNKLEKEAEKNWDLFYKRNTTKFFKDRHWTKREFEEIVSSKNVDGEKKVLFEVGCGVGNFMFPILEEDESKSLFIYACDFSKRAVEFVKEHRSYDASHCSAFHADIVSGFDGNIPDGSVDVATLIFVMSAIHPEKMKQALKNVLQTLKPGGVLLFRDYGLHDYAMLRFAPGHKLAENFYVRQDGTRAFYFSIEHLSNLVQSAGFEIAECQYVHRETINKKEGLCVPRIFVQAKFRRPLSDCTSPMCSNIKFPNSGDDESRVCPDSRLVKLPEPENMERMDCAGEVKDLLVSQSAETTLGYDEIADRDTEMNGSKIDRNGDTGLHNQKKVGEHCREVKSGGKESVDPISQESKIHRESDLTEQVASLSMCKKQSSGSS